MKTIVFDLEGDYGHFRIPYTTSSPLTFPFPPKPALYGIIGAFLGYDKNSYLENFQKKRWKFAIGIRSPIIKTYIAENMINTKAVKMFARMPKGKSCRTQINIEFLKLPSYRIYVTSSDSEALEHLEKLLKEHKSIYTVVLGLSECIANFKFIGNFEAREIKQNKELVEISSVIPLDSVGKEGNIDFSIPDRKFLKIHIPTEMKPDRELIETRDFLLEATGKTIKARVSEYLHLDDIKENIVLF